MKPLTISRTAPITIFPVSPQPGLFGGQFADTMANAPGMTRVDAAALGLAPNFSDDGTGLSPSLYLPQLPTGDRSGITYEKVAPPSDAVRYMLDCMGSYGHGPINVTSTSGAHNPGDPHTQGLAADITGKNPEQLMQDGANCGAAYQQNEYTHPSRDSTGPHVHLQLRPGRNGATGPYYPLPDLTPWSD